MDPSQSQIGLEHNVDAYCSLPPSETWDPTTLAHSAAPCALMETLPNPAIVQQNDPLQALPDGPYASPYVAPAVKPLSIIKAPIPSDTHHLQSSGSVLRKPVGRKPAAASHPESFATSDNGMTPEEQRLHSPQQQEEAQAPLPTSNPGATCDTQTQYKDALSNVVELSTVISRSDSPEFMPMMDLSAPLDIGFGHKPQSPVVSKEPPSSDTVWDSTPVSTFDPSKPKKSITMDKNDDPASVKDTQTFNETPWFSRQVNYKIASEKQAVPTSADEQQISFKSPESPSEPLPEVAHHPEHRVDESIDTKTPAERYDGQTRLGATRIALGWEWYTDSFGLSFFVNRRNGIATRQAPQVEPIPSGESLGPLPTGWEMQSIGCRNFFVNNHFVKQTWKDPRISAHFAVHPLSEGFGWDVDGSGRIYYIDHVNKHTTYSHPRGQPPITDPDILGPLPRGWQAGQTVEGRRFFINTNVEDERTWKDPRISAYFQTNPLPFQWEWDVTESGRIYFMDHSSGQTTFDDPRAYVFVRKPLVLPTGWDMTIDDSGVFSFYDSAARNVAKVPPPSQELSSEQIAYVDMSNKPATSPVLEQRMSPIVEAIPFGTPLQQIRSQSVASKASIDGKGSPGDRVSTTTPIRASADSPAQSISSARLPSPTNPYQGNAFNAQPQIQPAGSPIQSVSYQQPGYPQYPSIGSQAGPYVNNASSITGQSSPVGKAISNSASTTNASPFQTLCCHCQQGIPYNYQYQRCTFCDLNICTGCARAGRHPRHSSSRCAMEVRTWEPQFPARWCGICRNQGSTRLDCRSCQFSICDSCFIQHKGKVVHKHENSCLSRYLNPSHPKSGIDMNRIGRDGIVHGHCCSNETVSHCPRCLKPETASVRFCSDCPHSNYGYCFDCSEVLSTQEGGCIGHRFVDVSYQKVSTEEFNEGHRDRVVRCVTCDQSLECSSFPSAETTAIIRGHVNDHPEHRQYYAFVTPGMLRDIWAKSYMSCLRKPVRPDEPPSQNQTATFDCVRCRNGTKLKNLVSCVPCIRDPQGVRVCRQCFPFVAPTHEHSATEFICESDKAVPHDMLKIGWSAKQNQMGRLWYSYTDPYTNAKSIPTFNQQEALRGPNDPIPLQQTHTVTNQSFQAESKQAWNEGKAGMKQLWSKVKQPSSGQPQVVRPQSQVYGTPQSFPGPQPTYQQGTTQPPYSNTQQQTSASFSQQYPTAPNVAFAQTGTAPHGSPQQLYQAHELAGQGQQLQNPHVNGQSQGGVATQFQIGNPVAGHTLLNNGYAVPERPAQAHQPGGFATASLNNAYSGTSGAYPAPQNQSNQTSKLASGIGDVKAGVKDLWKKVPISSNTQQQQRVAYGQPNSPPISGSQLPPPNNRSVSAGPGIPQQPQQGNGAYGRPQAPRAKSSKSNKNRLLKGGAGVGGAALAMKLGVKALKFGLSGGEDFGDDDDYFGGGDDNDGGDNDTGGAEDYGGYGGDQTAVNDIGTNQDANLAYNAEAARGEANAVALI